MERDNFRLRNSHMLKALGGIVIGDIFGYLFYMFFLNLRNTEAPESASIVTAIFSIVVFGVSMFFTFRLSMWVSNDSSKLDEVTLLENAYKESNYTLDYNAYFKEQIKKRLWVYYLVAFLTQIPLVINYYLAIAAGYGTVYQCPIDIYKFSMTSLFGYELLGNLWFIGPFIYVILYAVVFTYLTYKAQKKYMVKPSYLN